MTQELYSQEQQQEIEKLEGDLTARMGEVKPKRLAHSLSVSKTAEKLALLYGVDPYLARVAGILHDWDKVVPNDELVRRAEERGIDLGVDIGLVIPLLHGILAEKELPELYPELPEEVFRAIGRHTTGAADMSPLDEVLFVADGIEPLRKETPGIRESRDLVGKVSLDDLFWNSFCGGMCFVVETRRYLYPGTLAIYNELALRRQARDARKREGR